VENKKTVVALIKQQLLNIDLSIATTKSEQDRIVALMSNVADRTSRNKKKRYAYLNCELEKNCLLLEKLIELKKELVTNINIVLEKYNPRYIKVFNLRYLENKSIEEISQITNYSEIVVADICSKLDNDLINYYC